MKEDDETYKIRVSIWVEMKEIEWSDCSAAAVSLYFYSLSYLLIYALLEYIQNSIRVYIYVYMCVYNPVNSTSSWGVWDM